jgi:hypothetical protein
VCHGARSACSKPPRLHGALSCARRGHIRRPSEATSPASCPPVATMRPDVPFAGGLRATVPAAALHSWGHVGYTIVHIHGCLVPPRNQTKISCWSLSPTAPLPSAVASEHELDFPFGVPTPIDSLHDGKATSTVTLTFRSRRQPHYRPLLVTFCNDD